MINLSFKGLFRQQYVFYETIINIIPSWFVKITIYASIQYRKIAIHILKSFSEISIRKLFS